MIKQKLKTCSVCLRETIIWKSSPRLCKSCATRAKNSLTQTESGLEAKPFKVGYRTAEIKKISTRQQKLLAAYKILRDAFMRSHKVCEARLEGCTIKSTELHHRAGRGAYLLDESKYCALCSNCHRYVTEHSQFAMEKGFSLSRLSKAI